MPRPVSRPLTLLPPATADKAAFRYKARVFIQLLTTSADYRRIMLCAWSRSAGNGTVTGCFVGLLAGIGNLGAARTFLLYEFVEGSQLFVSGIANLYGAHLRDDARSAGHAIHCVRLLAWLSGVDVVAGASLIGVSLLASHGSPLGIGALLLLFGARIASGAKNGLENNLFTCIRQVRLRGEAAKLALPVGQTLTSCEHLTAALFHSIGSTVAQLWLMSVPVPLFFPCFATAVFLGASATVAAKWTIQAGV